MQNFHLHFPPTAPPSPTSLAHVSHARARSDCKRGPRFGADAIVNAGKMIFVCANANGCVKRINRFQILVKALVKVEPSRTQSPSLPTGVCSCLRAPAGCCVLWGNVSCGFQTLADGYVARAVKLVSSSQFMLSERFNEQTNVYQSERLGSVKRVLKLTCIEFAIGLCIVLVFFINTV